MFRKLKSAVALALVATLMAFSLPSLQTNTLAFGNGGMGQGGNTQDTNNQMQQQNGPANSGNDRTTTKSKLSWQSVIVAPSTGKYTLYLQSEHGATLYVGDMSAPLISGSYTANEIEQTVTITMKESQAYQIKVEYFTAESPATLEWSGPGFTKTSLTANDLDSDDDKNTSTTQSSVKPATPVNLAADKVSENKVVLSWDPGLENQRVSSYTIYRNDQIVGVSKTTFYTDKGLESSTTYSYRVQAVSASKALSDLSAKVSVTTTGVDDDESEQVEGLNGYVVGSTIRIYWESETNAVGYNIYASTVSGSYEDTPLNGSTLYKRTNYVDASPAEGTNYYIVKPVFKNGSEGSASDEIAVEFESGTTSDNTDTISDLSATLVNGKVKLSWTAAENAIGYNVYTSKVSGSYSSIPLTDFPVTKKYYTDTKTRSGINYYIVKAVFSGDVEGDASDEVRINVAQTGSVDDDTFTATVESGAVRLDWDAVDNAIGYNLYSSTESGSYSDIPLTDFAITATTYLDTKCSEGWNYYIIKPVFSGNVEGDASEEISVDVGDSLTIVLKVGSPTMTVNGESQYVDSSEPHLTAPELNETYGRVFIPISSLITALGGTVEWDEDDQKVTLYYGDDVIEMWIGQSYMMLYEDGSSTGEKILMDVAPYINDDYDRTMLPVRFVVEYLGLNVQWDGTDQCITITVN